MKNDDNGDVSPQKKLLFFDGLHMSSLHLSLVTRTTGDAAESTLQNLQGNELKHTGGPNYPMSTGTRKR